VPWRAESLKRNDLGRFVVTPGGDDKELVERARSGDRPALEQLLATCLPDLRRYARRNCDSDDVEEAVQDALWILYRNVSGLKSVAAFAGWLFQVVRRVCLRYTKRRRAHLSLEDLPVAFERDASADDPELRARLSCIISKLPRAYREAIILKDIQGLSAEQMAFDLGVSLEAAKSRLHRARAMVREAYGSSNIASESAAFSISGAAT
jgi:RNA polymerase sigma factor (sigma-70 family)